MRWQLKNRWYPGSGTRSPRWMGVPRRGLAGCVGERVLTLAMNGLSHRMFGTGVEHSAGVRFHQKDLGPDGKDVRVWTISDHGDNSLLAEHCAASCGSVT